MTMTETEAFKVGFLLRCVEDGLTLDQAERHAARVLEKTALLGDLINAPVRLLSSIGPAAASMGTAAAVGLPVAAGLGGGFLTAKAMDNGSNVDEAKTDEVLAEYRRLTDQARRQSVLKGLRAKIQANPRSLNRF